MITLQLWIGVVFLIATGLLCLSNLRRFMTGRYFAEVHGRGLIQSLWIFVRSFWTVIFALGAIGSFFCAAWLARYILSH